MSKQFKVHWKKFILCIKLLILIGMFNFLYSCSPNKIIDSNQSMSSIEVALLLPSESQNDETNKLSQNLINSARLAVQDLNHLNINLSVYPTSGDKNRAKYAAKEALERNTQIMVGPLFSEETIAVKKAINNKIKILSLSNDPSVAGENVFIRGTTLQATADRLVKFALKQGLNRIAVIGPEGIVGINGIKAAKEAIKINGAFLTVASSYPLNLKGIQESAPGIYKEVVKSNSSAILFTDTPTRGLGFISEQLHQLYENNEKPQFMGLTRWDSTRQILNEPSLDKGWFVVPDQRLKEKFQKRYIQAFGTNPMEISSLSYDAIALIGAISDKRKVSAQFDFKKEYFLDQNGFIGINGVFRFKDDGNIERSMAIAEVSSGKFIIIDSAKNKF